MSTDLPTKRLILVVEDNPGDVNLLRLALKYAELDCELFVIDDGAVALEFVGGSSNSLRVPDLAIVDLNLPKHDGLQVLEAMRGNKRLMGVPAIILSSSPYVSDAKKLALLPAAQFITKPLDLDHYLQIGLIVKQVLGEQTSTARHRQQSV